MTSEAAVATSIHHIGVLRAHRAVVSDPDGNDIAAVHKEVAP
ncbi:hypothetical protein OG539_33085 [Actinacidiphila glaucinigra]|nr:hypothetical protein [Actinacidiphila glaucinigra]WSD59272.1 hypothetical protein OIE69_10290 [Actinacidiphila glaucinigra]